MTRETVPGDGRVDPHAGESSTGRARSRRQLLAAGAVLGSAAFAGCVTVDLGVSSPDVPESEVFEKLTVTGSWALNRAAVKVTLSERATTDLNVRNLTVVDSKGDSFWTGTVEPGQTSVSHVVFPVRDKTTLAAANHRDGFVESVDVTVGGLTVP